MQSPKKQEKRTRMWETHKIIGWRKVCLKNENYSKNVLLKHLHTKPNLYLTEVYNEKILLSFKRLWINTITVNIALCKSAQLGFPSFQRKADPLTMSGSSEIVQVSAHACLPQAGFMFVYMSSSEILCYLIGVTKKRCTGSMHPPSVMKDLSF